MFRMIGALVYIFGGTYAFAALMPQLHPGLYSVVLVFLFSTATLVFNRDRLARIRGLSLDQHMAELESRGKIERETIRSTRAICFEYAATGSLVYLVESGEQRLLCLYGQYFHEWEPITDDPEINQPRRFPTTEFDLLRRLPRREVADLALRGNVYEPDVVEPSEERLAKLRLPRENGTYLEGVSYESLLRELIELRDQSTSEVMR